MRAATLALFVTNALLMPLLVELVKEHSPGVAHWVARLASRLLPKEYRERYAKEWWADLEWVRCGPGGGEDRRVSMLFAAWHILPSAVGLRFALEPMPFG
jgi:hypothetical protein